MIVTVHLHKKFERQTADGLQRQLDVTMLSGSKVGELVYDLGIGLPAELITWTVNGSPVGPEQILQDGDQVYLLPVD